MDWISSLLGLQCGFCGSQRTQSRDACSTCCDLLASLDEHQPLENSIEGLLVVSAFPYEGFARALVLSAKQNPSPCVSRWFARCLFQKLPMQWREIPLLWLPGRPFSPTHLVEVVAWELSRLGQPLFIRQRLKRRIRKTVRQKQLGELERRTRDPAELYFTGRNGKHASQHVLLLDDVLTTGSTLSGCRKHLEQNANVHVVGALTLAFTPRIFSAEPKTLLAAAGPC